MIKSFIPRDPASSTTIITVIKGSPVHPPPLPTCTPPYEICTTVGPATVISSDNTPVNGPAVVRLTYVSPANPCGTVQAPPVSAVKAVPPGWPPLVKAQNMGVVPAGAAMTRLVPAVMGTAASLAMATAGKA